MAVTILPRAFPWVAIVTELVNSIARHAQGTQPVADPIATIGRATGREMEQEAPNQFDFVSAALPTS